MASKTQIRLAQLTGSLNDQQAQTANINADSLQGVLDHVASAIQRIHGASTFSEQAAGAFAQSINVTGAITGSLGLKIAGTSYHNGDLIPGVLGDGSGTQRLGIPGQEWDSAYIDGLNASTISMTDVSGIAGDGLVNNSGELDLDIDNLAAIKTVDLTANDIFAVHDSAGGGTKKAVYSNVRDSIYADISGDILIADGGAATIQANAVENSMLLNEDITIGSTAIVLGGTSTSLEGLTGLDFTAADASIAASIGANTLTIGGSTTAVVIAGDLTVSGETTTLDVANLLVEDPLIVLAKNQTAAAALDQGLVIQRSGDNYAMMWDESADKFVFANVGSEDGTTAGDVAISSYANLQVNDLAANDLSVAGITASDLTNNRVVIAGTAGILEDDANFTFDGTELVVGASFSVQQGSGVARAAKLEIDSANDHLDVLSSDLTATAAASFKVAAAQNIILDANGAEIFFDDNGSRFGEIMMISGMNMLALSSSAGNNIGILSQGELVYIGNADGSNAMSIDSSAAGEIKFLDASDRMRINLDSSVGDGLTLISGSFKVDHGVNPAEILLKTDDSGFTTSLKVASSLAASIDFVLPGDEGTAGYVLQTDGSGNTSWVQAGGASNSSKYVQSISATVTAGSAASSDAGFSVFDTSKITAATAPNVLDVFVNGQLLASSSVAYASLSAASDGDYALSGIGASSDLKFTFNLEADDVVTVSVRA